MRPVFNNHESVGLRAESPSSNGYIFNPEANMSKSRLRSATVVLLTLIGVISQHFTAVAQERERQDRGGRLNLTQFGGGRGELQIGGDATADGPKDMIALTVWSVTINNAGAPESDALVGQLIDKAEALPPV